jgi:hypothetical protein
VPVTVTMALAFATLLEASAAVIAIAELEASNGAV